MFIFPGGKAVSYQIANSLRFRASNSAYLSRTWGTSTNEKIFTFATWLKIGTIGSVYLLSRSEGSPNWGQSTIHVNNNLTVYEDLVPGSPSVMRFNVTTAAVFRDPSAWYHVVVVVDTTQAQTAHSLSDSRVRCYVNGVQQTTSGTLPGQNTIPYMSASSTLKKINGANGAYSDYYLAETFFIDGQALTPSSFGETNSDGVWVPKRYTGTYGTNGFHLDFKDGNLTAGSNAGLGKDVSGNGNYLDTNGISVTAGVTYDWMTDTPTNNYAVLNPNSTYAAGSITLSEANLKFTSAVTWRSIFGTMPVSSGKWYFEVVAGINSGSGAYIGIIGTDQNQSGGGGGASGTIFCTTGFTKGYGYSGYDGNKQNNGTSAAYGATYGDTDVIGVALDLDNNAIYFAKQTAGSGSFTWQNSGVPTSGASRTGAAYNITAGEYVPAIACMSGGYIRGANFGQRPFNIASQGGVPSGYKALCTANLPAVTITNPRKHFSVKTYAGTPGTPATITSASEFQPDFVWVKGRTNAVGHVLVDAVRGVQNGLFSHATTAETASATYLTAFNSDGFTHGGANSYSDTTMVSWLWKASGAGVSNTDGSITSTVSANTTAGFSIVTYTGNGSVSATVGHGLGKTPSMIIVKTRGTAGVMWWVKHSALASNRNLALNSTNGVYNVPVDTGDGGISDLSGSTTFGFLNGSSANCNNVNKNTDTFVAYCFAEIPGFSKFGSYTGNGSTDGPFVFCGFRPRWLLVKASTASPAGGWLLYDTARDTYNQATKDLRADLANAEPISSGPFDITANGFKLRGSDTNSNGGSNTYIYAAFAEFPNGSNVAPAPAR